MTTSGNILADRRYGWAESALDDGDFAGAADLAGQIVEIAPEFPAGWLLLGRAQQGVGAREAASAAFARALALDPGDALGAGLWLAQLGGHDAASAMSPAYVQSLFDEYAIRFDRHLVQSLHYRGPALLHDAVRRACSLQLRPFRFAAGIDLGCGTGLAGETFCHACSRLAGVDLSPAMVRKAEKKRLYDELDTGDAVAWLGSRPDASADLALAADLVVYIADLAPLFAEVARVLQAGGLFALTAQTHAGHGMVLGADARYAHGERYLRDEAARVGLSFVLFESGSIRQDRGVDVPGCILVLTKPSRPIPASA
jgi:predicted TPR repeat methyltransferase